MGEITNRATGKTEDHAPVLAMADNASGYEAHAAAMRKRLQTVQPPQKVSEESRQKRIAFIRAGGGHPQSYGDDNPPGRTPGDDGWNTAMYHRGR